MAAQARHRVDNVRIGPISVFALIAVLCLAVLSVLAFSSANAALTLSQRQAASGDVAQKLYDNGMSNFNKRNYSAAVRSFDDLTKTYPKNKLASNAWFWKGESYYQMKNYGQAALAYQNVIEGSPNSSKAPSSYLKQGMSFLQLNKGAAAKQRFNELIKKYPSSPEARRARQVMTENKL